MERRLVLIKPDAIQRALAAQIIISPDGCKSAKGAVSFGPPAMICVTEASSNTELFIRNRPVFQHSIVARVILCLALRRSKYGDFVWHHSFPEANYSYPHLLRQ